MDLMQKMVHLKTIIQVLQLKSDQYLLFVVGLLIVLWENNFLFLEVQLDQLFPKRTFLFLTYLFPELLEETQYFLLLFCGGIGQSVGRPYPFYVFEFQLVRFLLIFPCQYFQKKFLPQSDQLILTYILLKLIFLNHSGPLLQEFHFHKLLK